ncbi:unnamed protein product [Cuscuta campestris]|uniref:Helicase ATP-binding domain-containing protein n=1 Tax=Cuscuta campestris TaxID=132261 RepID=A0A484MN80_9ASTE|nr:unnamed protein product [Cuscuta campestris]
MASSSAAALEIIDDDDEFDWDAAVREIDVACEANGVALPVNGAFPSSSDGVATSTSIPNRKTLKTPNGCGLASGKQSTLDMFMGFPPKAKNAETEPHNPNGVGVRKEEFGNEEHDRVCFVPLDLEAAKTWIYPANLPRRDYQFEITRTALYSNTLVALPTGLGKTFIAAVVMYNYFRWFPEGKIVFAAPSKPLVLQQIEACHNIVDIPQECAIDLTGQTSPIRRASFWKEKRVFFVTPQVLERDILSGICMVKHLVCLVIDEAHRATGNYSYCVVVRQLMAVPIQLRILALSATPGSKQQDVQHIIDNLQITTLEYRSESDRDVLPHVHDRKIEHIKVAMGQEADEINNLLMDVILPFAARLSAFGVLPNRNYQTLSPFEIIDARANFRRDPPKDIHEIKYGDIERYFGVLLTLYHVRKLLSSHGIRPAFEMLVEKLREGSFARLVSRNEILLKAKLLMQKSVDHGAPNPKLSKMLEIVIDHFRDGSDLIRGWFESDQRLVWVWVCFLLEVAWFWAVIPWFFLWFFFSRSAMAEDGRVRIEKFNGTDFAWWKMQIEALLGECNLDMVLEEKPDGMDKAAEAIWDSKDKKAKGKITLALTRSVAFNIMKETTARGMLTALSNMYEKPSAGNRVFLMRELFMMRMNEGSPVADHINEVNSILSRLSSVGMKFDDDTQAMILLSSLTDSWSGFVTTVTESAGTGNLKFDRIRDSVLGEDIRRRNASGGSTSGLLRVSRGRAWKAMLTLGSWILVLRFMPCTAVKLGNGKILKVTGMGDIDLKTSFGTTWSLQNVRVIPRLKTKLISVGQLDEHGLDVKFGGGKWKVIKGNLVIARGLKRGSLYMVPVTSEGVTNPVKTVNKVRLTESGKAKKVHFANVNLGVLGMTVECVRRSESGQGFRVSGSMGRVLSTVGKRRWVLRTKNPNVKISLGNSLLDLESGNGPRCISGSGGLCKPVETEAVAVTVTTGLELGGASTVLSGFRALGFKPSRLKGRNMGGRF